jgi:hypothetical protein
MKKILSILLLGIFLFNTMGYYFVFKVNQSILRCEIRGMINSGFHKEMCILVKIDCPDSNPNFKKLDHHEFSYCGRLYDIVSESVKGNTTWYYCINDKQEERLIAGFEKIQNLNLGVGSSGKAKQSQALLYHLITIALIKEPIVLAYPQPLKVVFGYNHLHLLTPLNIPVSPPPELS